jgi:hypothetical protein
LKPSSLTDKLKALGVKVGTADLPAPKPVDHYRIDSVVPGSYRQTALGEVFVAEQNYPADYRHGISPIIPAASFPLIA